VNKVLIREQLVRVVSAARQAGRTIGICHGCFDILHLGHIYHFEQAKRFVDVLIISVTADKFVNKGPDRPVFSAHDRASFIAAIEHCDYVTINDSATAEDIIKILKPDKFFKGADYTSSEDSRLQAEKCAAQSQRCELILTNDRVMDSSSRIVRALYRLSGYPNG